MGKNDLIAYALDFVSFLISKVEEIDRVIVHGSIARGDFDKESDIDLFVDSREKIDKKVQKIVEDYYKTKSFKEWELKGIDNIISCIVGKLDSEEWKSLKRSMINTGLVLYGKYKADVEKVNQYVLFSFENIKPDKKRVAVFRKLFGFKIGNKKYPGLVEKVNGMRIGKGDVLVPGEYSKELENYFHQKKVKVQVYDFWSDAKLN